MAVTCSGPAGFEGKTSRDGALIQPGALTWEAPLPLHEGDYGEQVGQVDSVTRDEPGAAAGALFVRCTFAEDRTEWVAENVGPHGSFGAAVEMDELVTEPGDGDVVITAGRLIGVSLVSRSPWPRARLDVDDPDAPGQPGE